MKGRCLICGKTEKVFCGNNGYLMKPHPHHMNQCDGSYRKPECVWKDVEARKKCQT